MGAFQVSNFFHPAPKTVQKICAALKGVGGLLTVSAFATIYPWLGLVGLGLCVLGETFEKLTADPVSVALDIPQEDSASTPSTND